VAHQAAGFSELPIWIHYRHYVARRQCQDLCTTVAEQHLGTDQQCIDPFSYKVGKGRIDVAISTDVKDFDLAADSRSCRLHLANQELNTWTGGPIDERGKPLRSRQNSPSRLAASSTPMSLIPVTLPPGRLRLATRPVWTGSPALLNTIGIVVVAALAASAAGMLGVAMTATLRRTRSVANSGSRPTSLCAQRYSIATLWPST